MVKETMVKETMVNKAYVLKSDGSEASLPGRPTLTEAQEAVGGYVELLPKGKTTGVTVYANEDGRPQGLPLNRRASELLGYAVVGDVVVLCGWRALKMG